MSDPLPPCCFADASASLAQRLYAAYNRGGPADRAGLNFEGKPCPEWDALPGAVRAKWDAVAIASRLEAVEAGSSAAAEGLRWGAASASSDPEASTMEDPTPGNESGFLAEVDQVPGGHRMLDAVPVSNTVQTGARGAQRIPIRVLWRTRGTGFLQLRWVGGDRSKPMPMGKPALWPDVEYHNGNGQRRYMRRDEWLARSRVDAP